VDIKGASALHFAAMKGHEQAVFELLDRGCNPNLLDNEVGSLCAAAL
jgi:ankyrin repeat protein